MVFAMSEVKYEVNSTPQAATPTKLVVNEMTTATVTFNGNVEEWGTIGGKGFRKALKTATGMTIQIDGKRLVGDPGNDYIYSLNNKVGIACNTTVYLTFPPVDGVSSVLVVPCVINITGMGGAHSAVGTLNHSVISNGEWTVEDVADGVSGAFAPLKAQAEKVVK